MKKEDINNGRVTIINTDFSCDDTKFLINLDTSVRAYNCLKRAGILSINDFCKLKAYDLACIKGIGRNTYVEIAYALKEHGVIISDILRAADDIKNKKSHKKIENKHTIIEKERIKLQSLPLNYILEYREDMLKGLEKARKELWRSKDIHSKEEFFKLDEDLLKRNVFWTIDLPKAIKDIFESYGRKEKKDGERS